MKRDFKGIWIPREIWLHEELLPLEKLLWAEVDSLYDEEKGGCYASNEYLARFFKVSERYIREMLSHLKNLGLAKEVSFDGRERIIIAILPPQDFRRNLSDRNSSSGGGGTTVPGAQEPQFREGTPSPYLYYNKGDNKDKNIGKCTQSAAPLRAKNSNEISFSFDKFKFENISDEDKQVWSQLYPAVDISRELTEMVEWIKENPQKAKSKKHWRKFIRGWLQRQNEKLTNRSAYQNMKDKQVLSRHTGFQKDERPRNPNRTIDLCQEQ